MKDNSGKTPSKSDVLAGTSKLAVEGIIGITDLVEEIHSKFSFSKRNSKRKSGIAGFVYWLIRKITTVVGSSLDQTFSSLNQLILNQPNSQTQHHLVAGFNGVLGDYLAESNNPLAIKMSLRKNNSPISHTEIEHHLSASNGTVFVLLHGLCMDDAHWISKQSNFPESIEKELSGTCIQLFYNSGLHISENGQLLSSLFEDLHLNCPSIKRIVCIGHSMGGLVTRSAIHYGAQSSWVSLVSDVICIGTPHLGAPLEKAGNWFEHILGHSSITEPFTRLGRIRSSGVTDLRYAFLVDEDWKGKNRFKKEAYQGATIPLNSSIKWYAIASTLKPNTSSILHNAIIGDGLVTIDSGLGNSFIQKYHLGIPESRQLLLHSINHIDLMTHPDTLAQVIKWLK